MLCFFVFTFIVLDVFKNRQTHPLRHNCIHTHIYNWVVQETVGLQGNSKGMTKICEITAAHPVVQNISCTSACTKVDVCSGIPVNVSRHHNAFLGTLFWDEKKPNNKALDKLSYQPSYLKEKKKNRKNPRLSCEKLTDRPGRGTIHQSKLSIKTCMCVSWGLGGRKEAHSWSRWTKTTVTLPAAGRTSINMAGSLAMPMITWQQVWLTSLGTRSSAKDSLVDVFYVHANMKPSFKIINNICLASFFGAIFHILPLMLSGLILPSLWWS